MPPEPAPCQIVVLCEGPADLRTGTLLADRVLLERLPQVRAESLESARAWVGLTPGASFLRWASVRELAEKAGLRLHGQFDGRPGDPDAHQTRRALALVQRVAPGALGVLLLRDSDGCRKRISGIQQAVDSGKWPFETVLGVAHPNRECWVLAGYTPRNAEEQDLLRILREELGFDPCEKAHRLTARSRSQETKRSAKSVLGKLTNGRLEREEECLCADLPLLKKRGREIGLTEYLDQMAVKLVPGVSDATA